MKISDDSRPGTMGVLVIFQILYLCTLPFWLFAAAISPMAFGAPKSNLMLATYFVGGILSYPVLVIFFSLKSWFYFYRKKYHSSIYSVLFPVFIAIIWVILGAILLIGFG